MDATSISRTGFRTLRAMCIRVPFNAARTFVSLCLALVAVLASYSSNPAPPAISAACTTNVGGTISADETWTLANSPYCVTSELSVGTTVDSPVVLTIEPGVRVQFDLGLRMVVYGTLVARGTASSPITFTSNSPTPAKGDWRNIHFIHSPNAAFDGAGDYVSGTILQYAIVEYAGSSPGEYDAAVRIAGSRPFIDHNTIRYNKTDAIYVAPGAGRTLITNNSVLDNGIWEATVSNGIVLSYNPLGTDEVEIRGNIINNSEYGGAGIVSNASSVTIEGNTITGNYKGISGGGGTALVTRNTIEGHLWHGVHLNAATLTITDNTIRNNGGAGILLEKEVPHALIERNEVTHNRNGALSLGYASSAAAVTVRRNEFSYNSTSLGGGNGYAGGINVHRLSWPGSDTPNLVIVENNIRDNTGDHFYSNTPDNLNLESNYWGTTSVDTIETLIWHHNDNANLGVVDYIPFLSEPVEPRSNRVYLPLVIKN